MENEILAEFRNEGIEKICLNEDKVGEIQERLWKTTADTPLNQRLEIQSNLYQAYLELFELKYNLYLSAGELDSEFQLKYFDRTHTFCELFRHWKLELQLRRHHLLNTQLMEDIREYIYEKAQRARTQSRVRIFFDLQLGESSLILQNRFFTMRDIRMEARFSRLEKHRNYGINQIKFTLMLYHRICTDLSKIEDWDRILRLL